MRATWRAGLAALVTGAFLFGCGTTKTSMKRGDMVAAADGRVKVTDRDGANTKIEVKVKHLAPPNRIDDDATDYVVWVRPLDGAAAPQNVGALELNKELEGKLETITTYDKFEVFVTPEPDERATAPTGTRVLWSKVD